jgi:hypothetical protein
VQEIGDWLEKLGMPEYSECFAQNKIDGALSACPAFGNQARRRYQCQGADSASLDELLVKIKSGLAKLGRLSISTRSASNKAWRIDCR